MLNVSMLGSSIFCSFQLLRTLLITPRGFCCECCPFDRLLRNDTHMTSMKTAQFSRPVTPLVQLRPKFFHPLYLGRPILNKPPPISLPNDNQSIKKNIIQRWLLYVIRSFLPVGFCFHYQLIIFVFTINSLFLSGFLLTSLHLAEANVVPRAICKN